MSTETLVSIELMDAVRGAFFVLCLVLVLIPAGAWLAKQFAPPRKVTEAEKLGRALLREFRGDTEMAWDEISRIRVERQVLTKVASVKARNMPPSGYRQALAEFNEASQS
jgi:hypothetical protein